MHCQLYFQSKAVARLDPICKVGWDGRGGGQVARLASLGGRGGGGGGGDQLRVNSFTGRSNTFDRAEQQHCLQRFATGCFHPLAKPFQHLFFEKLRLASRANQFYVLVI